MPELFPTCELYELVKVLQEQPDMRNNINEALEWAKQRVAASEEAAKEQLDEGN